MKQIILTITMLAAIIAAKAETRLIGPLDLMDAWQFNYNASHWVEQANLRTAAPMYGEEPIMITYLSPQLEGLDWIQCAYGSKSYKDDVVATFKVKESVDVMIAHNDAIASKPKWLDYFKATPYRLDNSAGNSFTLFTRHYPKGSVVSLGPNGSDVEMMYLVAIKSAQPLALKAKPEGKLFDVRDFGAKGDDKTVNTAAIQMAIDKCSATESGGTVYIDAGIYVSGTLRLKDNVKLWVEEGAILRGSVNHNDYPQMVCELPSFRGKENYQLIYAEKAKNITISGGGIIDGYSLFEGYPWKGRNNEHERPRMIRMVQCEDVTIKNITLIRSANWTQYYEGCKRLHVENVTVRCYTGTNNQDGIDVSGCSDVKILNFNAICGDDAICIKALSMLPGENIYIDGVRSRYSNCNIVKIGTETHGSVRNMIVRNVEGWTRYATAIEAVDGAVLENITYENFLLHNCSAPFMIRLGNRGRTFEGGPKPSPVSVIRNVTLRNIRNTDITYAVDRGGPGVGAPIAGIEGYPVENVTIEDCDLLFYGSVNDKDFVYRDIPENADKYPEFHTFGTCPAYGIYFRHVDGVKMRNVRIRTKYHDVRPAIVTDDVKNFEAENITLQRFDRTEQDSIWHK